MRNVFQVLVNANDDLLVEGEPMLVSELRKEGKRIYNWEMLSNSNMPEFK